MRGSARSLRWHLVSIVVMLELAAGCDGEDLTPGPTRRRPADGSVDAITTDAALRDARHDGMADGSSPDAPSEDATPDGGADCGGENQPCCGAGTCLGILICTGGRCVTCG